MKNLLKITDTGWHLTVLWKLVMHLILCGLFSILAFCSPLAVYDLCQCVMCVDRPASPGVRSDSSFMCTQNNIFLYLKCCSHQYMYLVSLFANSTIQCLFLHSHWKCTFRKILTINKIFHPFQCYCAAPVSLLPAGWDLWPSTPTLSLCYCNYKTVNTNVG